MERRDCCEKVKRSKVTMKREREREGKGEGAGRKDIEMDEN